jgi:HEPN domain-containing protein
LGGRASGYHHGDGAEGEATLAREHLTTAQHELAEGAILPAIMFLHLAAEAAVVSLVEREGIDTKKRHDRKADAARELFRRGLVPEDLSEALRSLNQVRKDATYEGEDPTLDAEELEALSEQIEAIVVVAEERAQ